jgi:hypothetical protein
MSPKCKPYPPAARYKSMTIRFLRYDGETLVIEAQGDSFVFARIVFRRPLGFRVLDERDLCEFWNEYHERNGWFYEVEEGGWLALEASRPLFNSPSLFPDLREYLLVDDKCVSIISAEPPEILDIGAEPSLD